MSDPTPTPDAETIAWTTHLAGCDEGMGRDGCRVQQQRGPDRGLAVTTVHDDERIRP